MSDFVLGVGCGAIAVIGCGIVGLIGLWLYALQSGKGFLL